VEFGVSKWVSPKRTRSYPYERVYNTLSLGTKKVTIKRAKKRVNKIKQGRIELK